MSLFIPKKPKGPAPAPATPRRSDAGVSSSVEAARRKYGRGTMTDTYLTGGFGSSKDTSYTAVSRLLGGGGI